MKTWMLYSLWIGALFALIWLNRGGNLFVAFLASWAVLQFLTTRSEASWRRS